MKGNFLLIPNSILKYMELMITLLPFFSYLTSDRRIDIANFLALTTETVSVFVWVVIHVYQCS